MSTDNPVQWSALGGSQTGCPSTSGLKNLGAGNHALGAEIDNSAGYQYAYVDLYVRGADVFHAGDYVSVWFLKAVDGTNYEDGAAGTPGTTPARAADVVFPVRLVSTQQRITLGPVLLPGCKFKCLVQNNTNHGFTNTDNENVLVLFGVNDKTVTP